MQRYDAPSTLRSLTASSRSRRFGGAAGLLTLCLAGGGLGLSSEAWAQPEGGGPPAPGGLGDAHAVREGDTLWDLCAKYLNSPWYWPKIWSYNPQLTNPHWIYPGNEVRFYPGDEALPTEIDVGRAITVDDDDLAIPGALTDDDLVQTVGTIETGKVALDSVWTSRVGYVSLSAVERAGRVTTSAEEAILLSDFDQVYIRSGQPLKQGERFAVFRALRRIRHPITGEDYGYAVEVVGTAEVIDTSPEVATARIIQAYRGIERGDMVGPMPDSFFTRVEPVPNSGKAKGYVLETAGDVLGPLGEHHIVYIDRGRRHGVQSGNTFTVYHRGDGYTRRTQGLPNEEVGTLMVLDAQDEASTAIVMASSREISVGDKVEMVPYR